jgi:uncharacterized membrane protein YphA (DoxX/SURF4 family)
VRSAWARWASPAGTVIRLVAAAVWLVAGLAKVVDLEHFHAQVDQYRLLPGSLEAPFAYALPFAEIVVGVYLAIGLFIRPAAALACVLMVAFLIAQGQAWARGLSLDCGCFGSLAHERVGLGSILRDIALGLPSAVMLWRPARAFSLDSRLFALPDAFSSGAWAWTGGAGRRWRGSGSSPAYRQSQRDP